MLARCGKILPKLQVPCNRPAGHTGKCEKRNLAKLAVTAAAWQKANPERRAVIDARYTAAHPKRRAAASAAWRAANPERMAAINAAWNAAHPGRKATTTAAWSKANPKRVAGYSQKRRAIKKGATTEPFTQAELKARMASFGDACYYCALIGEVGPYECEDHVFPIKPRKGHAPGPHALRNLVPSCTTHNSQKHNKQPTDFINEILLATRPTT